MSWTDRLVWLLLFVSVVAIIATLRTDWVTTLVVILAWAGGIVSHRLYLQWVARDRT